MTTRRFLSLWLPRLRTDRARRLHAIDPAAPLAAIARIQNAQRLVCVDAEAARRGLTVGLSLADARARIPALVAVEADPVGRGAPARTVCDWASRYTPLVALDGADGLMLDISGVAHLFGGEAAVAEDFRARLAARGLSAVFGVASNPRAAWALARFSARKIAPEALSERDFAKLFHDLPLAALGLDETTVADMAQAGLRRIGDVALAAARADRRPLRAGADRPARRIARSRARRDHAAFSAARLLRRAALRLARPDGRGDRGRAETPRGELVALLERQAKGARRIELSLYRVDGDVRRIRVGASRPLNEARAILRLFAEKLASPDEDEIDAGFGVDCLRLACLAAEPLAPAQADLERAEEAERARALRRSGRSPQRAAGRAGGDAARARRRALARAGGGRAPGDARRAHGEGRSGAMGKGGAPARPLRLFTRPEPIEAIAGGSARRSAAPLPLAAHAARRRRLRRPGAHRPAVVGRSRRADPRLFPRRGHRRPPLLALPRRPAGAARRRGRNGSCTGCSGEAPSPASGRRCAPSPACGRGLG